MKSIILTVACILVLFALVFIGTLYVDGHIKRDTKFGKWWDKHICHELDPDDPNF